MSPLMAPRQAVMVCSTLEHSSPLSNAFSIAVIWPLILLTRFRSFSLSLLVCAILFSSSCFDDTIPGYSNEAFRGKSMQRGLLTTEQHYRQRERWDSPRIVMAGERNSRHNLVRVLALSMAVVFVFFVAQVLFHTHARGQNEATCQVCQAAHLGTTSTSRITSLVGPILAGGYVQPFVVVIHREVFFHDSHFR